MELSNFFRINLPYGIKKTADDKWFAFNREHIPVGWNRKIKSESAYSPNPFADLPIHTKYKGLTDDILHQIIKNKELIQLNDSGQITAIIFYTDHTNPTNNDHFGDDYFDIIKSISKYEV